MGTGFSRRQLGELHARLQRLARAHPPFAPSPSLPQTRGVRWVRPQLVVEIEYSERTRDGLLRQPVFLGLREDLDPAQIAPSEDTLEKPEAGAGGGAQAAADAVVVAGVPLSHAERILYPEQGVTKLDLARYYEGIRDWILPYLARRPLTLLRCPEGRQQCFYQKHPGKNQARTARCRARRSAKGERCATMSTSALWPMW